MFRRIILKHFSRYRRKSFTASFLVILLIVYLYKLCRLNAISDAPNQNDNLCGSTGDLSNCVNSFDFVEPVDRKTSHHLDLGGRWCRDEFSQSKPRFEREPQVWQEIENRSSIVYSAFLDRRTEVGGPLVRVIASGLQEAYNQGIWKFYCTLWYKDASVPLAVGPAIYDRIYPSTLHPEEWVAHFILCPLPSVVKLGFPYAVSVTSEPCISKTARNNTLMILNTAATTEIKASGFVGVPSFSLCLAPIYGNFKNQMMIIEQVELHKLLGVEAVWFYLLSVDKTTDDFLRWYAVDSNGSVNIVHWWFPPDKVINYFFQHSAINDCLYRAGYVSRYVSVSDLDEFIVPRKQDNWIQMMESISKPKTGAYLFQHAYFRQNLTGEEPYLMTQQSLWRTDVVTPPGNVRSKCLYEANKAIKANIHCPYKLTANEAEYIVPPEDGMLHHYRSGPMESHIKHPENYNFIQDTYMLKYKQRLLTSVDTVLSRWRRFSKSISE